MCMKIFKLSKTICMWIAKCLFHKTVMWEYKPSNTFWLLLRINASADVSQYKLQTIVLWYIKKVSICVLPYWYVWQIPTVHHMDTPGWCWTSFWVWNSCFMDNGAGCHHINGSGIYDRGDHIWQQCWSPWTIYDNINGPSRPLMYRQKWSG